MVLNMLQSVYVIHEYKTSPGLQPTGFLSSILFTKAMVAWSLSLSSSPVRGLPLLLRVIQHSLLHVLFRLNSDERCMTILFSTGGNTYKVQTMLTKRPVIS